MKKLVFSTAVLLLVMGQQDLWAQGCSMCTATASQLDGNAAKGLNTGIVYLAAIPLILIGTLFYKWYKSNKSQSEEI